MCNKTIDFRVIVLSSVLLFSAFCPARAEQNSKLDEKTRFDIICAYFQSNMEKEDFQTEAEIFLQKYPKSSYAGTVEYMAALSLHAAAGKTDLLEKIAKGKNKGGLLAESSQLMMAQAKFSENNIPETKKYLKTILARNADESYFGREALYGRCLIQLGMNNWEKAGKMLRSLSADNPVYAKEEKIVYAAGYVLYKQGKYAEAAEKFKVLTSSTALYYQAKCLEKMKEYIPAAILYRKLIVQYPNTAFEDKAWYSMAECFYFSTDYVSALAEYKIFVLKFPISPLEVKARYKIGCCAYNLKNYDEAVEMFENIATDPSAGGLAPRSLYMVGESRLAQGKLDAAIAAYKELESKFGDSLSAQKGIYKMGWCYTQKKEYDRAIAVFSGLEEKYPNDKNIPYVLFLIGENYRGKNNFDESIRYYQQVINHPLRDEGILDAAIFMTVKTYYERGQYDAIVSNFHYVVKSLPQHRSELNPYTHLLIAEAYFYLGLYTEAEKNYNLVISANKFGTPVSLSREGKAWVFFQLERYVEAFKQRQLLRDDWLITHNEEAKMTNEFETGDIYFNQRKYMEALDVFERFMADHPSSDRIPEAMFNAGRCYYKLAYYTKAVELWNRLVALDDKSEYAKEARDLIADTYFRSQKYAHAQQLCLEIIAAYPGTLLADKAQLRIAQSYYNNMEDKKAIEQFEICLAKNRDEETRNTAFEGLLASTYRLSEADPNLDYDINVLERNIDMYTSSKYASAMQYRVAERYYDRKDYFRAAEEFRKVVSDFPTSENVANAMFYAAESLYHNAQYEEAAAAYERYIKSYSKDESINIGYLHLANSLYYLEKYEKAAEKYRELANFSKDNEIAATAFLNASICYTKEEDWDFVISVNRQFVDRFPKNARVKDALMEIANAHEILSDSKNAIKTYREVLKVLPNTDAIRPEIQYKIAKLYLKEDNLKAALDEFEGLLPLRPLDDVWRLSGIAQAAQEYENLKDWGKALKLYKDIAGSTDEPKWVSASADRIEFIQKEMKNAEPAAK